MALNLYQYTPSAQKYGAITSPVTNEEKPQQGIVGDMADNATAGLFDSVGGVLDLVGAKGFAKDFYGWAEENRQEMSDEGRAAIGKSIFEKDESGEWSFGEGASDLDTWLLGFANMAGQFATSVVPGAGAGALAAKAGLAAKGVNAARIAGYAAGGGSAATGMAMEEGRQEVLAMPDDVLMKSDRFADAVRQTYKPDMSDDEAFDTAKAFLADQVAQEIRTDPKVLLANYGASAIGDPVIGRALAGARIAKGKLRSIGKGFVTEGATEAVQAGTTQYGVNEALQPIDGRDAWDGVDVAAANEGIMGGVFGGAAGGIGGVWNRQPEPVRDKDADAIRDKNPDLASAFDSVAQSSADRQADLDAVIGGLPAISQPVLEGELLGANVPSTFADNQRPPRQQRPFKPYAGQIEDKNIIFAADGRTEAERNPAMEGEWLSPEQRAANVAAGFIENAPIDLESEQVKQAKAEMERMRNQPRQITDKNVIFAGDGRPQQAAQEFTDNLQRQANQAASVPRLPQKDIIFAGDQSGVRVKGNGEVYQSPREAMTSKQARAMKRSGVAVEAVPFGDGWGWRVKEVQPEQQAGKQLTLKGGLSASIDVEPAPNAFSALVRMEHGEPSAIVARSADGSEIGRLTYMPNGGPIDVFVKEDFRRKGVATALYDELELRGGKIPPMSSGVAVSADAEAFRANRSRVQPAPVAQPTPVQFKKSGEPFKAEKEMKMSASYKAASAGGVELETVKVDGGFGFRVKATPMEVKVAPGGLSEGHDSTQPTSSESTPTRLGDGAEAPNTITEPIGAAQTENSNVSLAAPVGASQPETIDTELGTSADVTLPTVEATTSVIDGAPTGNAATELPQILRMTKKKYIAQQVKQQKLKESSPGYAQAVARLEEQYESDLDRAQASLTFEQFNALNDDSPEPVNRQAYKALREEFGLPVDMQFSKRTNKAQAEVTEQTVDSVKDTDNPDIQFTQQNTIKAKPAKGINIKLARQLADSIMSRLNGAAGIKVVILETQAEAEKLWQMSLAGELVRGAYNRATNTAYVIAENIRSTTELRTTIAHEVLGHGGLKTVIKPADYAEFIERLKRTRNNRAFENQWTKIDNDYDGFSEDDKAEEIFAYFVQEQPLSGPVKFWWNALKRFLHKALQSVGLVPAGDPDVEAMQDMLESIRAGFMFNRSGADSDTDSELAFKKSQPSAGAFNRWFGGSKVVDENGDPLVVYHGTNADFSVFSDEKLGEATGAASATMGFFFASNPNVASSYADTDSTYNRGLAGAINRWTNGWYEKVNEKVVGLFGATARTDGGNVMPVYLAIKNPLVVDQEGKEYREQTYYDILVRAKNGGHDGVIIKNTYDEGFMDLGDELTDVYIAFNPTQIKSATGNNGDFDPTNPDIRFSKSRTAEAVAGTVTDFVGRKRLDPNDPYAVENRRLKEQDKTLWEKAKQVFMRNFAPGGMLPRSIFDAKITRDGELESGEMTIKHLIFALERAVQKDTGKNVDNQSDEFINMMADALAGKVDDKLGSETKAALVAMRQYIDSLSGDYLSVIQVKIDALNERIKAGDRYTDKVQALNEIELYEKIKGNMGVYVNRSYRAFDDPKWFQKVPVDVINRAREYLRKQYKSQGDDQAEANRKAEVTLNKILKTDTAYDSMASFIAESKLGAKDLSTLIARKDISPEIRELLGEYKDPRMNFAKTATKMSRLVWNSRFLDKVKADGVGVFFFDEDSRPAEATVQIAGDNSKSYEPLNGYWTYPEVAQALQDSLGTEQMEAWYEAVVKFTSMVKYGKTVLSPTTAMRNWQSAMFFAVANGHFDFKHMKKSLAAFREQVSQNATGDDLAYLKKLKKLGVVYDAPYAGEMMQLLADSKIDDWLEGRKGQVFGTARQINNLAQGFYSFGDDFWKIIGYENEKANFISAGLSEAEAEKMAAERIRNTYPTYSMVGRAIKKLARFPLMGTFVSFPAEIIRTTANMLRYAAQDMKSDNPKIRAMARKRLTGMALVSGMFYALSAMTAAMLGVDDEEEEAIRDVGPSWQKNSTFLFYGRDDKGKLQYFDISFLDPYGYFKRPITALLRDQPWEDAAASGAADMLSPFFGADITAGTFFQVFANKKQSGGQVYNEYADGTDQLVSIADHIWTGLRPGFVNNAMGIFNAVMGNRREGSGKEYDLGDEMMALLGWRASSLDAPTALYYRSFDFADQLQAANSTLNKVLRSDNSVDDDDIADAKEEAQRQYDDAFKQMQRIVQSGRNAGMTKEQVYRTLKLSGVSNRNISGLINGNIPPMQAATLQTQVKAVTKAREIRGDEQASEVLRRFQIARQLQ